MDFLLCHDTSIFMFPVNLIAGAFLIAGIWTLHQYYSNNCLVRWLYSMPATLFICGVIITILIIEGIWAPGLFRSWIFIFSELLLLVILGLITLRKITGYSQRNLLFLLNHGGLWLALFAALFGAPDREEYKMIVPLQQTEYNAIDRSGRLHPLPFTVSLKKFEIEYYDQPATSRTPKSFCSTLQLTSQGEQTELQSLVNHPAHFKGYSFYQDGYDTVRGSDSPYTILLVVRDPWLRIVYLGIFMLLAGAFGLIIYGPVKKNRI